MRLFLSYGHDANEELVRRIRLDLEKRGHDVWFDRAEIRFGDDWRAKITDGILKSDRVVSFLSKHSTRDPGVCLDELGIAVGVKGGNIQTVLVESEEEVRPPPSISHVQWLDMHQWREQNAAGGAAWESWYQSKFSEIVGVVESDASRRFAGEIETLSDYLKPVSAEARLSEILRKGFQGRTWLLEAMENWRLARDQSSRLFWIEGEPGVGKSAFAAHLAHYGRDKIIAVHFCEWDKPDHREAARIVRSLAFQMATRLPDYRKLLLALPEISALDRKDAAELFDYLLANPLQLGINGGRTDYLIVIDALDEAEGDAGRNPFVELLARRASRLPDWLRFVVTSRPESAVQSPLSGLNPFVLDTGTEANRVDLRNYLQAQLASRLAGREDAANLVDQIVVRSEGVFLYVERFCEEVRQGRLALDRPDQYPEGLSGIFFQYFDRQFRDEKEFRREIAPALRTILAARGPLPLGLLQRALGLDDEGLGRLTARLGSLFPVATENGVPVIRPCHKALADWMANSAKSGPFFCSTEKGAVLIADACWEEYRLGPAKMSLYTLGNMLAHLLDVRQDERLNQVLIDLDFLETKIKVGLASGLLDDWRAVKAVRPDAAERFTQLAILHEVLTSKGVTKLRNVIFPPDFSAGLTDQLQRYLTFVAQVDVLAAQYNNISARTLKNRTLLLTFVIVFGAELLYWCAWPTWWLLFVAYILFHAGLSLVCRLRRRSISYRKSVELRGQAEALQVQFFWWLAEVDNVRINGFLHEKREDDEWILPAFRSARVAIGWTENFPGGIDLGPGGARLEFIRQHWLSNNWSYLTRHAGTQARAVSGRRAKITCLYSMAGFLLVWTLVRHSNGNHLPSVFVSVAFLCAAAGAFVYLSMRRGTLGLRSYDVAALISAYESAQKEYAFGTQSAFFDLGKAVLQCTSRWRREYLES